MDITDEHAVRARFAETYSREGYPHPLRQFEQYERVMACREATGAGNTKLSNWFDLPKGRLTHWIYNDGKPTGYDALERADSLGLLDLDWGGEQFRGLNELVAWVFSGGYIADSYTPLFNVGSSSREVCTAALDRAGVPGYIFHENEAGHGDTEGYRITDGQALFGRLLVALGAPRRRKSPQQYGLPCYLGPAPDAVRRRFVAIYLLNRGVQPEGKTHLIVREERSTAYLEALAGLFRSVTDAPVSLGTDYRISIGDAVLSDVDVPKKFE